MERALSNQKSLWQNAVDQLLPQSCLLCATTSRSEMLCASCAGSLPAHDSACCPVCALPSPGGASCGACLAAPPHFDATSVSWRYAFPLDKLMHEFKYGQKLALSRLF